MTMTREEMFINIENMYGADSLFTQVFKNTLDWESNDWNNTMISALYDSLFYTMTHHPETIKEKN